jgi:hypothetical protein
VTQKKTEKRFGEKRHRTQNAIVLALRFHLHFHNLKDKEKAKAKKLL